jgi:hypothetical protein
MQAFRALQNILLTYQESEGRLQRAIMLSGIALLLFLPSFFFTEGS